MTEKKVAQSKSKPSGKYPLFKLAEFYTYMFFAVVKGHCAIFHSLTLAKFTYFINAGLSLCILFFVCEVAFLALSTCAKEL